MISLLAIIETNERNNDCLLITSIVGSFAQIPLIHSISEYFVKHLLVFGHLVMIFASNKPSKSFINKIIYLIVILLTLLDALYVFLPVSDLTNLENVFPFNVLNKIKTQYPFVPLMLFSVIENIN